MARWSACLLLLAPLAAAEIIFSLDDGLGDVDAVRKAQGDPKVKAFWAELDALEARLLKLKQRDLLAMFGQPATRQEGLPRPLPPPKPPIYALPVAQPRWMAVSGRRYRDEAKNKDHIDFHDLGVQVYYGLDGVTPGAVVFWFPADQNLPRLGQGNLDARLQWERAKWNDLVAALEKRRAAVFPWVVDQDAEAKFYEGPFSTDPAAKLEAWKILGEKLGYRYEPNELGAPLHTWRRPDRTRALEASLGEGSTTFTWYDADGESIRRRENGFSKTFPSCWRWYRPGSDRRVRAESPDGDPGNRPREWSWWDAADRLVRHELDDNSDGIPDVFEAKLPKEGDDEEWQPLDLGHSWAVHPELIPLECRIEDQPERCVPLRKAK